MENRRPVFTDPVLALNVLFSMTTRLAHAVLWAFVALAHAGAFLLLLAALWWWEVSPQTVSEAVRQALATRALEAALLAGVSGATVLALYWKLVRWIARAANRGWFFRYLFRDSLG